MSNKFFEQVQSFESYQSVVRAAGILNLNKMLDLTGVFKGKKMEFKRTVTAIAVFLGVSFKPGSDDTRDSKSILFIKKFLKKIRVKYLVYDEKVKKINVNGKLKFVNNKKPKFNDNNFYILLTGWKSYISFLKKISPKSYFDTREVL